jgi:hypothetical protein
MVELLCVLLAFHGIDQFSVERGLSGENNFHRSNEKVIPHIWIAFHFEQGHLSFLCGLSLNNVNEVELCVVGSFGVQQNISPV